MWHISGYAEMPYVLICDFSLRSLFIHIWPVRPNSFHPCDSSQISLAAWECFLVHRFGGKSCWHIEFLSLIVFLFYFSLRALDDDEGLGPGLTFFLKKNFSSPVSLYFHIFFLSFFSYVYLFRVLFFAFMLIDMSAMERGRRPSSPGFVHPCFGLGRLCRLVRIIEIFFLY